MYLFHSFMKYNVIWHSIECMIWITRRVSSGAGYARLSSTLEFTFDCQWSSCCLMFRSLNRASFSVPFYLVIILSVTYMCVSGIDFAYILLYAFPIGFWDCFLLILVCHFINIFNSPLCAPGWIGWNNFFYKSKLCKNTNIYHVTFKEELEDTKGVIRSHKSNNKHHNGQKKKDKQRFTKHTHQTKYRVTRPH